MANEVSVKKIPITLDRERNLIVDLNTFCSLEDIYGSHKAAIDALKSGSFKAIRTFLWLTLVHEDETLTEHKVGQLLGAANMSAIADVILESIPGADVPGKS
ncbi:hypothetical protein COLU111180_06225 [Cohnella lubricantis]|uniref:Phage tail assembly protein n=1 Tax=Cohnella lubricantis TaxID=2163172 RepID=A0A841TBX2_9BACL|nr:hypothetical protein [Cohnella lubricantis]MBB6677525.1 hypothetical protein [Cohnella lubricantis]MBP2116589.1 hypothetical protein [Cohnella lubricantis]